MSNRSRKLLAVFALLSVLLAIVFTGHTIPSQAAQESPTPTAAATSDQSFQFERIQMLNATDGWAAASAGGDSSTGEAIHYVLRTKDGGKTWTNATPPGFSESASDISPSSITFLDEAHAWFVYKTMAWRTSDGGQTWSSSSAGLDYESIQSGGALYASLDFVDPTHGWLLIQQCCAMDAQPIALYQTTDGGVSWTKVGDYAVPGGMSNLPDAYHLNMAFQTPTEGWMTLSGVSGLGMVEITHDGGKTWTKSAMPTLPDRTASGDQTGNYCDLGSPTPFSGSFTFVARCSYAETSPQEPDKTFLCHTTDDGATWQISSPVENLVNAALEIISPTLAWGVVSDRNNGSGEFFVRTTDGGQTWTPMGALPDVLAANAETGYVPEFDFIDQNTGWAIDSSGGLQYTADAGKTWTALNAQLMP